MGITFTELALTLGVSRDAMMKTAHLQFKATQGWLREMLEVLNRVEPSDEPWAGSLMAAYAWYRWKGLPTFGDATAETLARQRCCEDVRNYMTLASAD